jgi:hypothetical protein
MKGEIKDMEVKDFFSGEDSALIDSSVSIVCCGCTMNFLWAKKGKANQVFSASSVNSGTVLEFFIDSIRSYYKKHPEAHYYVTMNSNINMATANAVYDTLVELGADVMIKEEFWIK